MDDIDFKLRLEASHRYHALLAKSLSLSWIETFNFILRENKAGTSELLVLLDSNWHESLGITPTTDPRGRSNFHPAMSKARCRSEEIWGYQCPYFDSSIEIDHIFPYSRGGSTSNDNAMYLCIEHNRAKSNDVHLLPWEKFPGMDWIQIQLNLFINRAQTFTSEPLYFPKAQFKRL